MSNWSERSFKKVEGGYLFFRTRTYFVDEAQKANLTSILRLETAIILLTIAGVLLGFLLGERFTFFVFVLSIFASMYSTFKMRRAVVGLPLRPERRSYSERIQAIPNGLLWMMIIWSFLILAWDCFEVYEEATSDGRQDLMPAIALPIFVVFFLLTICLWWFKRSRRTTSRQDGD